MGDRRKREIFSPSFSIIFQNYLQLETNLSLTNNSGRARGSKNHVSLCVWILISHVKTDKVLNRYKGSLFSGATQNHPITKGSDQPWDPLWRLCGGQCSIAGLLASVTHQPWTDDFSEPQWSHKHSEDNVGFRFKEGINQICMDCAWHVIYISWLLILFLNP